MSAPLTSIPSGTQWMPRLYVHAAGPLSAAYYCHHFERMEAQARPLATWNHAAAWNTLGWLCLRRMWLAAGIYATTITLLIVLWWAVVRPLLGPASALACAGALALLSVVLPGLWGNQLYYQHLRARTLQTLQACDTIAQAQQQLGHWSVTAQRRNHTAAVQAAVTVVLVGAGLSFFAAPAPHAATAPAAANGPPVLHFPAARSAPIATPTPLAAPAPASTTPQPVAPPPAATPLAPKAALPSQPLPAQAPPAASTAPVATPTGAATPPARSAKTATAPTQLVPGRYYLNAGVFAQVGNADKAEQALRQAGLPVLRSTVTNAKGEMVRLRSGPFESAERARAAQRAAAQRQLDATVFQHRSSS